MEESWGSVVDDSSGKTRGKARRILYLRPNLLYTKLFVIVILLWLPRRSDRSAGTKAAVNVLLFFLCRLQNLFAILVYAIAESILESANLEGTQQTLIHTHHCASVVELPTVIWCTEQSNQLPLGEEFITILNNLMSSAYQIHVMFLKETWDYIWSESERYASIVLAPASDVLIRIWP